MKPVSHQTSGIDGHGLSRSNSQKYGSGKLTEAERNGLYQNLDDTRSFRILLLFPGTENAPLSGKLLQALSLGQTHDYHALSYRWSEFDPVNPTFINIEPLSLPIGPHLHAALIQFRHETNPRHLWIDQICIDQQDEKDKAHQIAIMADIYSNAAKVLVWLGPSGEQSDLAMEFFPTLIDQVKQADEASRAGVSREAAQSVNQPRYGTSATALSNLFSRDWFGRVWTLQEAALGKTCEVWCGQSSFLFDLLNDLQEGCNNDFHGHWADALDLISSGSGGDRDPEQPLRPINTHINIITMLKSSRKLTSARLLNSLRFMDCSQHEDRVKSILHFLEPDLRDKITCQLKLSAAAIFHLVACYEIERGEMNHLCAAGLSQHRLSYEDTSSERPRLSLPSWVPDWTFTIRTHSFWVYNAERLERLNEPIFTAGGPAIQMVAPNIVRDRQELQIKAIVFDTVQKCTAPFRGSRVPNDITDKQAIWSIIVAAALSLRSYIISCMEMVEQCSPQYGSNNVRNVCRRTLLAGMTPQAANRFTSVFTRITDEAVDLIHTQFETWQSMLARSDQYSRRLMSHGFANFTPEEFADFQAITQGLLTATATGTRLIGAMAESCKGRKFIVTADKHFMGLVPDITIETDKICVIPGCCAPFVIRPEGEKYRLIGECYIDGVMDGELITSMADKIDVISLV